MWGFPRYHTLEGWALGVGLRNSSRPKAFLLKGNKGQKKLYPPKVGVVAMDNRTKNSAIRNPGTPKKPVATINRMR